jgi:RNA recognition motif-containing protein
MRGNKLFVGNLSYSVTVEQLKELFSSYGSVTEVKIIEGKGFGFVEMSSPEEAERAQEALRGYNLQGRSLNVDKAKTKGSGEPKGYQVNRRNPRSRPAL